MCKKEELTARDAVLQFVIMYLDSINDGSYSRVSEQPEFDDLYAQLEIYFKKNNLGDVITRVGV